MRRKRFGQHFLSDNLVISQIIRIINPLPEQTIIEIGPGTGAITVPLITHCGKIVGIEIDRDLSTQLRQRFPSTQLTLYTMDVLSFDFSSYKKLRVVGNLPYNISTELLFYLHRFHNIIDMTFMLQYEVAARICAMPNSSHYGRLSIMLQADYDCQLMLQIAPKCFDPPPKVNSAIIRLRRRSTNISTVIYSHLSNITRLAFNQRRKMISNSLASILSSQQLHALGIESTNRAENLSVSDYLLLADFINKNFNITTKDGNAR